MGHYYFQKIRISVILLTLLILPLAGWAQVGIGTTTPDSNALLELDASTTVGGFLMPRVALTATDNPSPLSGIITPGMTVYNTATAGSGANVVTPGFYYHDGTIWIRVGSDADAKNNWSLTGNSGTNPTNHFLGTKDAQPLLIKTNGIERMRVLADGNVGVNTGNLLWTDVALTTFALENVGDAIAGSSAGGIGVYGQSIDYIGVEGVVVESSGLAGVVGSSNSLGDGVWGMTTSGEDGVYGQKSSGIGNGVFGNSSNVGVRGLGGHGAIFESGLNNGYGVIAWNTTLSGNNRNGLVALGQNLDPLIFAGTGAVLYGRSSGGSGWADNNGGTGLIGVGNDITTAK